MSDNKNDMPNMSEFTRHIKRLKGATITGCVWIFTMILGFNILLSLPDNSPAANPDVYHHVEGVDFDAFKINGYGYIMVKNKYPTYPGKVDGIVIDFIAEGKMYLYEPETGTFTEKYPVGLSDQKEAVTE